MLLSRDQAACRTRAPSRRRASVRLAAPLVLVQPTLAALGLQERDQLIVSEVEQQIDRRAPTLLATRSLYFAGRSAGPLYSSASPLRSSR